MVLNAIITIIMVGCSSSSSLIRDVSAFTDMFSTTIRGPQQQQLRQQFSSPLVSSLSSTTNDHHHQQDEEVLTLKEETIYNSRLLMTVNRTNYKEVVNLWTEDAIYIEPSFQIQGKEELTYFLERSFNSDFVQKRQASLVIRGGRTRGDSCIGLSL